MIADPPVAGAENAIEFWFTPAVGVGADIVFGTVVIVTDAEADDAVDVPAAFVAVTVKVTAVADGSPVTVIGEDDPVPVCPVLAVTVYEVAAGDNAGNEKETVAEPLLYGLDVPTFVAETPVGANGSKKSFDAWDFLPDFFPAAMLCLLFSC